MRLRSLAYHDVAAPENWDRTGFRGALAARYKLTPELLRDHLTSIAERVGSPPVTAGRQGNLATNGAGGWMLTFDDGGVSAHSQIAAVLGEFGWPAHFLIITDCIGKAGYLDRTQIREIRAQGHVIGTHTCSHPYPIAKLAPSRQRAEWERSILELSEILGERVDTAALPGGSYSRRAVAEAAEAGVRRIFTLEATSRTKTISGCLVIGRHLIRQGTPCNRAAAYAAGDPLYCWPDYLAWNLRKIPKRVGGARYESLKKRLLD